METEPAAGGGTAGAVRFMTCRLCGKDKQEIEFSVSERRYPSRRCRACLTTYQRIRLDSESRPRCSIEGCNRVIDARGLCRNHYVQARSRPESRKRIRIDHVSRVGLIERYGAVCHLCDDPIDLALRYPDSWSFSTDHVQPAIDGVVIDSWENCKPAHLRCNLSRFTMSVEEYRQIIRRERLLT